LRRPRFNKEFTLSWVFRVLAMPSCIRGLTKQLRGFSPLTKEVCINEMRFRIAADNRRNVCGTDVYHFGGALHSRSVSECRSVRHYRDRERHANRNRRPTHPDYVSVDEYAESQDLPASRQYRNMLGG